MAGGSLLPPPDRNRLLPISITLLSGRNPRIRGFGWGRVGVGGAPMWQFLSTFPDPHPRPLPTTGRESQISRTILRWQRNFILNQALLHPERLHSKTPF